MWNTNGSCWVGQLLEDTIHYTNCLNPAAPREELDGSASDALDALEKVLIDHPHVQNPGAGARYGGRLVAALHILQGCKPRLWPRHCRVRYHTSTAV